VEKREEKEIGWRDGVWEEGYEGKGRRRGDFSWRNIGGFWSFFEVC
jgi:hypothetical protein